MQLIVKCYYFSRNHRNGFPVSVPSQIKSRLEQVKKDMKLNEETMKKISSFTIFGFEIMSIGSTNYPNGALLGIPINFSYETTDDMAKKDILVCLLQEQNFKNNLSNIAVG